MKQFKRKIVVITEAACKLGYALASKLAQDGARVMIVDKKENILNQFALATGAIPVVTDFLDKDQLSSVVNKTICRFGKIDLFISLSGFCESEQILLFEKERVIQLHRIIMSQMYAAKYALPFMIKRGNGYFLNTMPAHDLMKEFHLPYYSTTKHPALSLAERLRSNYRNAGIKVSLLNVVGLTGSQVSSTVLATMIIQAVQKEQFIITPIEKPYKQRLKPRITMPDIRNRKIKTAA